MNKTLLNLIFHIGFLCVLPLLGHSLFNMGKQLIDYYNYGYFYTECMVINNNNNEVCKSDNIIQLGIAFSITSALFTFMANAVRKQIVGVINPKVNTNVI